MESGDSAAAFRLRIQPRRRVPAGCRGCSALLRFELVPDPTFRASWDGEALRLEGTIRVSHDLPALPARLRSLARRRRRELGKDLFTKVLEPGVSG